MRRLLFLLLSVLSIQRAAVAQQPAYFGAAWSNSGSMLALTTDQALSFYDVTNNQPELIWSADWAGITSTSLISFSPDDTILATGHGNPASDTLNGRVVIWNAASGERITTLEGSFANIFSLAFSRTDSILAVGSGYWRFPLQDHVSFWTIPSGIELRSNRLAGDWAVYDIAFSPDGRWMAYSTERTGVYLVETTHGTPVALISIPRASVEFSSDSGSLWLLTSEYQLQEWQIRETPEVHLVSSNYCRGSRYVCLIASASVIGMNGNWYVTANRAGQVSVSHLPDGNNYPSFTHVKDGRVFTQAIISPDETRVALLSRPLEADVGISTTFNDEVAIWTLQGGEYIKLGVPLN